MSSKSIRFKDLGLSSELLAEIAQAGFEIPTPVQEKTIPIILKGHDVVGCAQTGTGKTLAFGLPLLEKFKQGGEWGGVILCPTREIALQTFRVLQQLGSPLKIASTVLIGGRKISIQAQALKKKPPIIVATPGRLLDHLERKNLNLKNVQYLVMDEADHMLDLGFLPQVREILRRLPEKRQTLMFSATFPAAIERLAKQFLHHPKKVEVVRPGTVAQGVNHSLYLVDPKDKRNAILVLLKDVEASTLVFTRTKLDAEWLYRLLNSQGQEVHALHSDRSQGQRTATLAAFKKGDFSVLVATDLLARGIDISDIKHVINYDIPHNPEDYIHRVGRTARGKATGDASTLATWKELQYVEAIEKQLGSPIPRKSLPGITEFKVVKTAPSGRRGKRVRLR